MICRKAAAKIFVFAALCSAILFLAGCGISAGTLPAVSEKVYAPPKEQDFLDQPYLAPQVYNPPVKVKGIYLTGWKAGIPGELEKMINLVDTTELNAMVIDVKDNTGRLTYKSKIPMVAQIGSGSNRIPDIDGLLKTLKEHGIYTIGRIVVFEDPVLSKARPAFAVKNKKGENWVTRKGLGWVDPYNTGVWDYAVSIAEEAARKGFNEIQFDYVRFPSDGDLKDIVYPANNGRSRVQTISAFLSYAKKRLEPYGVYVSADIFGLVTTAEDDMKIGQYLEDVVKTVDYISPMVYPSHYAPGSYGLSNPNAAPYETVYHSLSTAVKRLEKVDGFKAEIRPWLQDFTLGAPPYGPREVRAQIKATYDAGLSQWILWDPANTYTVAALIPEPLAKNGNSRINLY
ncbi:MAG TPA: putative glycoside hydrolase [Thermoanaerobacterales bacterium]|nr:putative glycoside hydrolase [Thermoanaerobacterales bacterium]